MGTINEKLDYLKATKAQLKTAIEQKGVTVPEDAKFRTFTDKITSIVELKGQSKEVNPATSSNTVTPDTNYNGLTSVTVKAVTSDIDENIKSGNIKYDSTILGITGELSSMTQTEFTEVEDLGKTIYSEELPNVDAGYTKLEYIQSDGNQYIDTGISAPDGFKVITKFNQTVKPTGWSSFIGCEESETDFGNRNAIASYLNGNGVVGNYFGVYSLDINYLNEEIVTNTWYKITATTFKGNPTLNINGVDKTLTKSHTSSLTNLCSLSIYLFAMHTNNGNKIDPDKCALGVTRIYDENGTLKGAFIPARREIDSEIGMYDSVTKTFFTNRGTGKFTAGRPLSVVQDYFDAINDEKDQKLIPENIRKGVTIFGVEGTYEA